MIDRLLKLVSIYVVWVLVFVLQKPLFMLRYSQLYSQCTVADWLSVMEHGLPLDFSMAGYLTAFCGLVLSASAVLPGRWAWHALRAFLALTGAVVGIVFVADLLLYDFWGFRLDSTPIFYLLTSPKDAFASVGLGFLALGLLAMAIAGGAVYILFSRLCLAGQNWLAAPRRRWAAAGGLLLCTALLFIPIRGGFTVSTMNTGKVYFSTNMRLNHAALNPAFNLMESLSKQKAFDKQYRFMPTAEAENLMAGMLDPQVLGRQQPADSTRVSVLNTQRPEVLIMILESFSSHLMASLGGEPNVAVHLDSLASEGVLFTHFYANSFRTDRGLVSVLSGYPAQPTTSLMKYPRKTQQLPAIVRSLKAAGYDATYYYGGDADFTNMRSYLMSQGIDRIVSDVDFPVNQRLSKWGVHDHLLFDRLLDDLKNEASAPQPGAAPHIRVLQTSSSHEPFEVPYDRLAGVNERLNAFAYTDECVGRFIREFRQLPQWQNTLVVMVPDHLGAYPENLDNLTPERYQIPLLLVGGAVKAPMRVDVVGSQHDLAATLLAQMGLPHDEFTFSKDLLSSASPHFAFFTVPDAFGFVDDEARIVIYDNKGGRVAFERNGGDAVLQRGQAYLQAIYDDIAKR